jgi:very-short-patch-repair endonuclease
MMANMASDNARALRTRMTDAERRLWSLLRGRRLAGYKFRRQHPLGPFILDFACFNHQLAVEADGGQHADSDDDQRRTRWIEAQSWRVLRFWNNEILTNPSGVTETIVRALEKRV